MLVKVPVIVNLIAPAPAPPGPPPEFPAPPPDPLSTGEVAEPYTARGDPGAPEFEPPFPPIPP